MAKYRKLKQFLYAFCFLAVMAAAWCIVSSVARLPGSGQGGAGKVQTGGNNGGGMMMEADIEKRLQNISSASKSYFEDGYCFFNTRYENATSTSGYTAGDAIPLATQFRLTPEAYGRWEEDSRRLTEGWTRYARYGQYFSDFMPKYIIPFDNKNASPKSDRHFQDIFVFPPMH